MAGIVCRFQETEGDKHSLRQVPQTKREGEPKSFQHKFEEQESWRRKGYGLGLKASQDGQGEEKVTQFIFAYNRYLVSSSRKEIRKMMTEVTSELKRRGFEWKEEEMEFCCVVSC